MNALKFKAFIGLLFFSAAIAGVIKVNYAISHLYSFYDSATVETVRIDSVSLISADPAYGVIGIVGYGPLATSGVNVRVDMTDAININSFTRGEAYSLKGRSYSVYYNPDFESARFHLMTLEEIRVRNFSTLIIGIVLILPFVLILFFWFWNKKRFITAVIALFLPSIITAQDDTLIVPLRVFSIENCKIYHHVYHPDEKVVLKFNDTLEAKNTTPEELIASILSEKSKAWTDYNTIGESEYKDASFYSQNSSSSELNVNLYLLSKLIVGCPETPVAYIKFAVENENSKFSVGVYRCIWNENRWKIDHSHGYNSDFSIAYALFDQSIFHRLLVGNALTTLEQNLLDEVSSTNLFSIDGFASEVLSWFQPKSNKSNLIKIFTNDPGWN